MAEVSPGERAQLILVGGIVVAFALVAIAMLLNSALYTENLATRGIGPEADRAGDLASFAERGGTRVLVTENSVEYESWTAALFNGTVSVAGMGELAEPLRFSQNGGLSTIAVNGTRRGAGLVQTNGSRNFTAEGSTGDPGNWTLVETAGIRAFHTTVNQSGPSLATDPSRAFTIRVQGTDGGEWSARIYANGTDVEVNASGTVCRSDQQTPTINWTGGTLGSCDFPFGVTESGTSLTGPYTVSFANGSRAGGSYELFVSNESVDDVHDENVAEPGSDASPRWYHAVYSISLDVEYEEGAVTYRTRMRVAPDEPDETRPEP